MKKLLKLGIREQYPQYLKNKLRVSNVLYIIIFMLAVGYSSMIALRMPELGFIPIVGIIGMLLALAATIAGFHSLYRILLCLMPFSTVYSYHIGVVADGNPALPSSIAMILAFTVFPFVVFDVREKASLGFTVLVGYFSLISFRWTNSWLETTIDDTAIRTGMIQEVSITASFVILCSAVFFLNYFMYRAEKKRELLWLEGERRNEELRLKSLELETQMNKLAVAQQEEQQRNWAAQGFSHFAGLLRSNDNLEKLANELVKELTKYVQANQAAFYMTEGSGEEVQLELKACYAYNRKKYREQRLAPGEGLVGQCYLERDTIYMTQVPQGYTNITSGLGDATPSAILIVPLIANEKVEGVIEFASFTPFPEHVHDFLQKLGVDIAATLSISRINTLTRQLLEDAQQQAEQMRAQEEEMRQNMEELAATQEEMQRKEQEYVRKINHLEEKLYAYEAK